MITVELKMLAEAVLAEWRQRDAAARPVGGAAAAGADTEDDT